MKLEMGHYPSGRAGLDRNHVVGPGHGKHVRDVCSMEKCVTDHEKEGSDEGTLQGCAYCTYPFMFSTVVQCHHRSQAVHS